MGRIAVDVVVLPDEVVSSRAVRANAGLVAEYGAEIVLDGANCLAHCSLCMGCLDEADMQAVGDVLRAIAVETGLEELLITQTYVMTNSRGQDVSNYVVEKTAELVGLHKAVMAGLEGYLSYDVTAEMLCGDEEVAATTLEWIREYRAAASFEKFIPHVTLGYGAVGEDTALPLVSRPVKLAICHLGNHCTCRKVLQNFRL